MPVNFSLTFTLSIRVLSHRSNNFCLHRRFIGELLRCVSKFAQRGTGSLSVLELSAQECDGNGEGVEGGFPPLLFT